MDNLQEWVFHYNIYTKKWEAVKRDNYNDLFCDQTSPHIIRSSRILTLVDIISKTDGDLDQIKKLCEE